MLDEQIAHQLALAQVIETVSNYGYIVPEIIQATDEALASVEVIATLAQLKAVQKVVDESLEVIFSDAIKRNAQAIKDITKAEVAAQLEILKANGYPIKKKDIDDPLEKGLNRPIKLGNGYQKSADMMAQASGALRNQAKAIVAGGYYGGETIQTIKQALRGTSTVGYKDGLGAKAATDFSTITRTQATAVENQAKVEAYKAVDSDGYVYNAIVDSRTSSTCRTLHGRKYIWGEGRNPIPPMHYNCRSSIVPFFKGEPNKLVGENYYTWLKRQPAGVQDEVLGQKLGKVFRNAGLNQAEFRKLSTNRFGEPLTIAEMTERDARIAAYLQPGQN